MRLAQLHPDPSYDEQRLADLRYLLEQPTFKKLRPCADCNLPCPCCQSSTCTCLCGPDCKHASRKMSIEPDRYPIEGKILSLVFAFNCLRICPTFWSCQGHLQNDGVLRRVPQVWFYSRSVIYPRLISDLLSKLLLRKVIRYPWHVCVTFSGNGLDTGFSIEPDVKVIDDLVLDELQADTQAISESLVDGLRNLASDYLRKYSRAA